jgi:hypothetical protein
MMLKDDREFKPVQHDQITLRPSQCLSRQRFIFMVVVTDYRINTI